MTVKFYPPLLESGGTWSLGSRVLLVAMDQIEDVSTWEAFKNTHMSWSRSSVLKILATKSINWLAKTNKTVRFCLLPSKSIKNCVNGQPGQSKGIFLEEIYKNQISSLSPEMNNGNSVKIFEIG